MGGQLSHCLQTNITNGRLVGLVQLEQREHEIITASVGMVNSISLGDPVNQYDRAVLVEHSG